MRAVQMAEAADADDERGGPGVLADGAGDEHGFAEGRLIYRETIVDGLVGEPTVTT